MKTTVNCGGDSELDLFGHVQPMKFIMKCVLYNVFIRSTLRRVDLISKHSNWPQ